MTMVQVHDGGGPGRPELPAQAGTHEQTLYELYDFQTGIVSYTASQWRTTASEVTELAASVRRVVRELRNAPDGGEAWSGDAAEAAYATLGRLATNLDTHAEEIARIESGLTLAGDAVVEARTAYVTSVRDRVARRRRAGLHAHAVHAARRAGRPTSRRRSTRRPTTRPSQTPAPAARPRRSRCCSPSTAR